MIDTNEFIEHYGKKGMKWGVRRKPVKTSSDYRKTAPLRNRKTRELSNKQLQQINSRINMEQQYRKLNPTKIQKGELIAKSVVATAGTIGAIFAIAQTPHGKAMIRLGKQMMFGKRGQMRLPGIK